MDDPMGPSTSPPHTLEPPGGGDADEGPDDPPPDPASTEYLAQEAYRELRQIAARYLRGQRSDHTLQPTALVHEAFIRLARRGSGWESRGEFVAVAATAMRRILVDCARRRGASKRRGGTPVTLVEGLALQAEEPVDLLALDAALTRLAALEERPARVVELRFFGGLEIEEVAEVLEVSSATVKRDWRFARAWLARELGSQEDNRREDQ
jgi:RNA polymerase sigma-70 factor, ECF subfamily